METLHPFHKQLPSFLWLSFTPVEPLSLSVFSENGTNSLFPDFWVVRKSGRVKRLEVDEQGAGELWEPADRNSSRLGREWYRKPWQSWRGHDNTVGSSQGRDPLSRIFSSVAGQEGPWSPRVSVPTPIFSRTGS